MSPVALKACLDGARRPGEHPALPLTPLELAEEARAARAAGAAAVPLHPRDETGRESLGAAHIGAAVRAVRRACPGPPVGVSTGLWISAGDAGARRETVLGWAGPPAGDLPDFASANLSEPGFPRLWHDLRRLGVDVEAGVWSEGDAEALAATGLERAGARRDLRRHRGHGPLPGARRARPPRRAGGLRPRLLHGEEATAWALVDERGASGYGHARRPGRRPPQPCG